MVAVMWPELKCIFDLGWDNVCTYNFLSVDQSSPFLFNAGRIRVGYTIFHLSMSLWDIRSQSQKLS